MPADTLDYDPEAVETLWADIERALRSASVVLYRYRVEAHMSSPAWKELKAIQDSGKYQPGSRRGVEILVAGRTDSMDRLVSEFEIVERETP